MFEALCTLQHKALLKFYSNILGRAVLTFVPPVFMENCVLVHGLQRFREKP